MLDLKVEKFVTTRSGLIIQGLLWLVFWLGPAFSLYKADPRWAHNFAVPIIFLTVGLAANSRKISCELIGLVASFMTIPIFLAYISGITGTYVALMLLLLNIILYLVERKRVNELLNPKPRLKAWLKIHQVNLAYIGLAHMPLVFFFVRWIDPNPFLAYLPSEHETSTSSFNLMLLVLALLGIMERYVQKIGRLRVSVIGFIWAMLMIVIPLVSIVALKQ